MPSVIVKRWLKKTADMGYIWAKHSLLCGNGKGTAAKLLRLTLPPYSPLARTHIYLLPCRKAQKLQILLFVWLGFFIFLPHLTTLTSRNVYV